MSLLSRLIHLLVAIALLAMLGTAGGTPSGSSCLKLSSVEMCFDPALRVAAETSGDQVGKKCFDAILLADVKVGLDSSCVAVWTELALARPLLSPIAPWKPPRVSV